MEKIIVPELMEVEHTCVRSMKFKYRLKVEGASSIFQGESEIINNNSTNYNDTI